MLPARSAVKPRRSSSGASTLATSSRNQLEEALSEAAALNPYRVGSSAAVGVPLGDAGRYAPSEYATAVRDLSEWYKGNTVISIDLKHLERRDAIRLVDFCSGMAAAKSGWVFRVAEYVIVLTPRL